MYYLCCVYPGMSQCCECLDDVLPRTTCVVCVQVCLSGGSVWMMCYHVLLCCVYPGMSQWFKCLDDVLPRTTVLCVSRYVSVVQVFG